MNSVIDPSIRLPKTHMNIFCIKFVYQLKHTNTHKLKYKIFSDIRLRDGKKPIENSIYEIMLTEK